MYADLPQPPVDPFEVSRLLRPHVYTGTYYTVLTSFGWEIVAGWEVGPLVEARVEDLAPYVLGRYVGQSDIVLERRFGPLGCLRSGPRRFYAELQTPWLAGTSEQDVFDKLWVKYRFVSE